MSVQLSDLITKQDAFFNTKRKTFRGTKDLDFLSEVGYLIPSNMNTVSTCSFFPQYTYYTYISYRNGQLPRPDVTADTQTKSEGTFLLCFLYYNISIIFIHVSVILLVDPEYSILKAIISLLFCKCNNIMCKVCLPLSKYSIFLYAYKREIRNT